jgi:hypothetical protein
VQEAESLSTLTSKDSLLEPKNPYRFYQTLRSSLLKDPLLPEPEYFPFRFSTLRAKAHPVFSLNDLPQGSNSHGFTSLFHQLETRLQGPYMESLQAQIKDRYGYSVETLSFNLLQGDLVQKLLQLKDPISSTTLQLYYILASIAQKTSDSSLELSPQEIALLDFAAAMSVCKVGQLDAIALFYSRLPSSEQTNNLTGQSPSLQVLTEFIHTSIQSALQDTFAKPALLTELSNDQEVKQAAHQTLYLKNRLFQQVGLVHTLTFDPHSHIIKDSLISNSLDCLLQAFVKHFPLNALLEKFKNAFSNQPLYMTVREILEKISTEKQLQERMSYHEDTFAITLSLEAVLALLQELNYLKPSS